MVPSVKMLPIDAFREYVDSYDVDGYMNFCFYRAAEHPDELCLITNRLKAVSRRHPHPHQRGTSQAPWKRTTSPRGRVSRSSTKFKAIEPPESHAQHAHQAARPRPHAWSEHSPRGADESPSPLEAMSPAAAMQMPDVHLLTRQLESQELDRGTTIMSVQFNWASPGVLSSLFNIPGQ